MPVSGIAIVDSETQINDETVTSDNYGYCFYSTYVHKSTKLVNTIMRMVSNKDDFLKIILFDHIIYNADRNPGNLLVQYKKDAAIVLKVIDHSHVFKHNSFWSKSTFQIGMKEDDYNDCKILDYNDGIYSMIFRNTLINLDCLLKYKQLFSNVFTKQNILNIINDIPKEWYISYEDVEYLIDYIMYRMSHFEDICKLIIQQIKD